MKNKPILKIFQALLIGAAVLGLQLLSGRYFSAFQAANNMLTDALYQHPGKVNPDIKIIAVDEETIAAFGRFEDWSRDKSAELINILSENEAYAPSVIALDFLLIGDSDPVADEKLAAACEKAGNVVLGTNIVYRTGFFTDANGQKYFSREEIETIEEPFEALKNAVSLGFTNTVQDNDGYIRHTRYKVNYKNELLNSFSYEIYSKYQENLGKSALLPKTYGNNLSYFKYSGNIGGFEHVSFADVINGKVDPRAYAGCIVLVGAYAPGMQDAYNVAVDRGSQMYGVEIHANIIQSLLECKNAIGGNAVLCAIISALICGLYFYFGEKQKLLPALLEGVGIILLGVVAFVLFAAGGIIIPLFYLYICVGLLMIYFVINKYVLEKLHKRKILTAFQKYVAPQVVKEISRKGDFEIQLSGEKRDIAVLFVDIRGFTPMSEGLEPEQVVGILNRYLELTSSSIFKNNGTLDKFIGDATMAVFNAPVDLDDYVFRAVCTAMDIVSGTEELGQKLLEEFGKTISFGIGVNCGPAVVGNIGSEKRMDYTAIGDTVNTAARLESVAGRGQVLISEAVYERIKDRIDAVPVGELSLKGKSNQIMTYELKGVHR